MARDLPGSASHEKHAIYRVQHRLTVTPRGTLIAGFILLLSIAGIARLLTFEQYLPYLDSRLEGNMFLLTLGWRGFGNSTIYGASVPITAQWLSGYPPLFVWLNSVIQVGLETFSTRPWLLITDYVYVLRVAAVGYGIITTALIASIGWQLGGRLAAWLSGVIWALSPVILANNSMGIPDPIVYMLTAASLSMALRAWELRSPRWAFASLIAAIIVIYTKYPAFVVLIPWGIVTLALLKAQFRVMRRWLLIEAVLSGLCAAYLLLVHHALSLSNGEGRTFQGQGLSLLLDLPRNLNNWRLVVLPIGTGLVIMTLVAGALAYTYNRQHGGRTLALDRMAVLLIYSVAGVMITASFIEADLSDLRHTLPITGAMIPLWSAAVTQILWAFDLWAQRHSLRRFRSAILARLPVLVGLIASLALAAAALRLTAQYRVPHTVRQLWRWADGYLPNDGVILMYPDSYLQTAWNRPYSGYDGSTAFTWEFDKDSWQKLPGAAGGAGSQLFHADRTGSDAAPKVSRYPGLDRPAYLPQANTSLAQFLAAGTHDLHLSNQAAAVRGPG